MDNNRCQWAESSERMRDYHDNVWGKVEKDNNKMFRALSLEIFQAGLSWSTILDKLADFDVAFENFEIEKVAKFDETKVEQLLADEKIVRHRQKIEAVIKNAKTIMKMDKEFSKFIWSYVIDTPIITPWIDETEIPSSNFLSDKICEDMKGEGFKFIGSTTIYSFLQAIGLLNDHIISCDFK